jgi:hypothetical protein
MFIGASKHVFILNIIKELKIQLNFIIPKKNMKTKICALCKKEETVLYRVQNTKGKIWIFVCTDCCNKIKTEPNYRYGGTWKGDRH